MTVVGAHLVGRPVGDLLAVVEHDHAVEMSITTPMSCSISTMVVPNWSFTSRMKRHMSCFSSTFMPAIGSSSSSSVGSAASARPSSTRFCRP
jgi:hypothetical protein